MLISTPVTQDADFYYAFWEARVQLGALYKAQDNRDDLCRIGIAISCQGRAFSVSMALAPDADAFKATQFTDYGEVYPHKRDLGITESGWPETTAYKALTGVTVSPARARREGWFGDYFHTLQGGDPDEKGDAA